MTLTILQVAYSLATVAPCTAGGAEQVLAELDRAVMEAGWQSIVVACEGSSVRGTLCATPPVPDRITDPAYAAAWTAHRQAIAEALDRWPLDVVHLHGLDFVHYLPAAEVPTLATLHLPPAWYPREAFALAHDGTYLHCVSESQRRACPPGCPLLPTIENGVHLERFAARVPRRDHVLALGRICPEKGYHLALDAARRADVSMELAGHVHGYAAHLRYFEHEIRPRLDARRRFIGAVSGRRKRDLLASARCLLVPSQVPETSSLVAMEALASGTPVVAFPAGALADVVEDGVTGFLVRDEREMADAIVAAGDLDPDACRERARRRFSAERMTRQYLQRYAALAHADPVAPARTA